MTDVERYHTNQESVKLVIDRATNRVKGVMAGKEGGEERIHHAGEAMLRALNSFVEGELGFAPKIDLFTSEGRFEALTMLDSFSVILDSIPAFLEEQGFFRSGDEPKLKSYLENKLIPAKKKEVAAFMRMINHLDENSRVAPKRDVLPRNLRRVAQGAAAVITLAMFLNTKEASAASPTREQTGNTPDTTATQVPTDQESSQNLISRKLDEISFSVATYLDDLQNYLRTYFPEELKLEGEVSSGPTDDVEVKATPAVPTNTPEKSEGNPNPAEYEMTGMEGFAVSKDRTEAVFKYVSETKNTPLASLNEKGSFFSIASSEELTKVADLLDPSKGALHTKIMEWGTYANRFGDAATTRVYFFQGKTAQETRVAFSATLTKDWSNEGGEKYPAGSTVFLNDESKHLMVQPRELGRKLKEKEGLDFHVVKFSKLVANEDAKAQLVADFERHQTALPSDDSLVIVELFTDAGGVVQLSKIVDAQGKFLMEFDVSTSAFSVVKPIGTQVPEDITSVVFIPEVHESASPVVTHQELMANFPKTISYEGKTIELNYEVIGELMGPDGLPIPLGIYNKDLPNVDPDLLSSKFMVGKYFQEKLGPNFDQTKIPEFWSLAAGVVVDVKQKKGMEIDIALPDPKTNKFMVIRVYVITQKLNWGLIGDNGKSQYTNGSPNGTFNENNETITMPNLNKTIKVGDPILVWLVSKEIYAGPAKTLLKTQNGVTIDESVASPKDGYRYITDAIVTSDNE